MTCASCANRIERRLNKLDGVTATVNYATEKATVEFDPRRVGRRASWSARSRPPATRPTLPSAQPDDGRRAADAERRRDRGAAPARCSSRALLSVPVLLMSMIPALQFDNWQWLSLHARHARRAVGARGRSTGPRGRTSSTAPRRWTR